MDDEILLMIEDCERRESKLTKWEINFIQSISEQAVEKKLTSAQMKTLQDIWEKVT